MFQSKVHKEHHLPATAAATSQISTLIFVTYVSTTVTKIEPVHLFVHGPELEPLL